MATKQPEGVVMSHKDTPQQVIALRKNKAARLVREQFAPGTRVRASIGGPLNPVGGSDMPVGVVQYTVPALTSLGGVIVVVWPNGQVGRHTAIALRILD